MSIPKLIKEKSWGHTAFFIGVLLSLSACHDGKKNASETGDVKPVVIQTLRSQSVQDTLEVDGNTSAVQQVNLVARVAGVLERIHFKDGEKVHKGQVLFTIEQEPYVQQVKLNQARVVQAKSDYARQLQLLKENATAQSSVENSLSNLEQVQANLRLAQINLSYTTINAPFDGVISKRALDIGNYVGASAGGTTLATLMQVSPIYVYATVGEREALRIREKIANQGKKSDAAAGRTAVQAMLQGETQASESGVIDFVDHQAGQTSGAVVVRGNFANTNNHLVHGFYAKLLIDIGEKRQALVVPARVVMADQQGEYVFVVSADNMAQRRVVKTATLPREQKEILSGLDEGDQLVVEGYVRLSDGAKVNAKKNEAAGS
jgi:RND family efflux transporter MFP subunit